MATDPDKTYWDEYSNLQHVKHELIRQYLGGWFAILGTRSRRALYVDTHAGRGRHSSGKLGSPLVAINALLKHPQQERLLRTCEFIFHFVERDEENFRHLQRELSSISAPRGVNVQAHLGDAFAVLRDLAMQLQGAGTSWTPAFVFVDPYGFKLPGALLRTLMTTGHVELFINLMWREIDMAIASVNQRPAFAERLDEVFAGPEWRSRIRSTDIDERADQAVDLLAEKIGGRWSTFIRMLGDNRVTRYLLVHLSNSDRGRDLMKDCVWKICPDGGFYVRKGDHPGQGWLITPQPDWSPLEKWIVERLRQRPLRWQRLQQDVRPEIWRETHLNEAIRRMHKGGRLQARSFTGKFSAKANPLLALA